MSSTVVTLRRGLCAALILSHLACTSWRAQPGPADQVLAEREVRLMRVHLADSSTVTLRSPRVEGDSLVGMIATKYRSRDREMQRRAVPLSQIARVATGSVHAGKTAALTVGVVVGVGVVAVGTYMAILCSGADNVC